MLNEEEINSSSNDINMILYSFLSLSDIARMYILKFKNPFDTNHYENYNAIEILSNVKIIKFIFQLLYLIKCNERSLFNNFVLEEVINFW